VGIALGAPGTLRLAKDLDAQRSLHMTTWCIIDAIIRWRCPVGHRVCVLPSVVILSLRF